MTSTAQAAALVVAVLSGAAGAWAGWLWWQVAVDEGTRLVWRAIRGVQALYVAYAALAGVEYLDGMRPGNGLYSLYVGLPIAVSVVAEQLRALSAQTVLDARGLKDAAAVGELDEAGQRSVVRAILRRELGVMAAACGVGGFLLLRAYGTV